MPITQDRVLALLNAALDYQQALDALIMIIKSNYRLADSEKQEWQAAMQMVNAQAEPFGLLTKPRESVEIIAAEKTHFRSTTISRNNWQKERQQRIRASLGITQQRVARKPKHQPDDYEIFEPRPITTAPSSVSSRHHDLAGSLQHQAAAAVAARIDAEEEEVEAPFDPNADDSSPQFDPLAKKRTGVQKLRVPGLSEATRAEIEAEAERALEQEEYLRKYKDGGDQP